jgi:hypothetical protein
MQHELQLIWYETNFKFLNNGSDFTQFCKWQIFLNLINPLKTKRKLFYLKA